ncbi:carboxypeptidase regulatory-like domain-containing protein [Candidatus Bathyarchaeota archaeon]|nr:carboxypeptidase regulatory-like domain-containing protein [Candidatus Bathyarchaeota archaeon]MBS7627680.1 carboxypeptidase regulatory-like domain-containing protein [Candidatus Bathyarchaeota archaeon]
MKRVKDLLILNLITLILALLLSPFTQIPSAQTTKPLIGATITVEGYNGFALAMSGSDGAFIITEGLGDGSYTVCVSSRGYLSKVLTDVVIKASTETNLGDITLEPSGIVKGRVVGPDGEPISGAVVSIILDTVIKNVSVTGTDGTFTFDTDLESGTYKILASAFSYGGIGFQMGVPILRGGAIFAEGYTTGEVTGVKVVQGQETTGIEVKLGRSGIISGMVKEKETGNPIPGVIVLALQPDDTYGFFGVTGSDGKYKIANNLASGTYNVTLLFPKGYVWKITDAKVVEVRAGEETGNVDFELEKSGIISGLVVYSDQTPAPNATVIATSDYGYFGFNITRYDGTFRIESGLATGTYMVMAFAEDLYGYSPDEVDVEAGKETRDVKIILPGIRRPWCIVAGKVTDSQGKPLEGVTVRSEGFTTSTDEEGRYELTVKLPVGVTKALLNVSARMPGYEEETRAVQGEAGKITSGVDFVLPRVPSGILRGRVLGLTIKKVATLSLSISKESAYVGERVTLSGSLTPSRPGKVSLKVSKNGGAYTELAELTLVDGAYSHAYRAMEEGTYRFKAMWPGDEEYEPAESGIVTLTVTKPPKTPTSITCSLAPASLPYGGKVRIMGLITPALPNITVSLKYEKPDGSQFTESVKTYENGSYHHEYTPDQVGLWRVEASWLGNDQYLGATSPTAVFTVTKVGTTISISVSKAEITEGNAITVSGSITPSPGSVTVILSYRKPDGTILNRTVTSTPAGAYTDTWNPSPKGSWSVTASWSGSGTHGASTSSAVAFTVKEKGLCIIATATYGSELTPEVQYLRGFRDRIVLSTFAGSQFMELFNAWYYSFSPSVASFIAENSLARSVSKTILYPLMGILHLSASTYGLFSFNNELGVIMAGLVASSLIGFVYFSPILTIPIITSQRLRRLAESKIWKILFAAWIASVTSIAIGEACLSPVIMMASSGAFVLATLGISATLGALALATLLTRLKASVPKPRDPPLA